MMHNSSLTNLSDAVTFCYKDLLSDGSLVETGRWQGIEGVPKMMELLHYSFTVPVPKTPLLLEHECQPDLPWAEEHFQERVGGKPTNPGQTYFKWPYYKDDVNWREGETFTHTYQERLWTEKSIKGVRYNHGNLADVVKLLNENPRTRQAYVPVWFPEDTGVRHQGRVPCTIGYHFILRDGKLDCTYYIRSVDVIRHLKNDLYMAGRLMQWVSSQLGGVEPGNLIFLATSMHCFETDLYELKKRVKKCVV